MNTHSNNIYNDIDEFFASEPTANEKAWGLIHDFYHMILTYMEEQQISKADLAHRLGKSRSAITQMFNKTPNITLKKMIEIADAIGLELEISSPQIPKTPEQEMPSQHVSYQISIPSPYDHFLPDLLEYSDGAWEQKGVLLGKQQVFHSTHMIQ